MTPMNNNILFRREIKAELSCSPPKGFDGPVTMLLFIGVLPRIDVGVSVFQEGVEDSG